MKEKLSFIRFPIVLIVIFFVGRLVMGAAGASYEAGNRVFSMLILTTHLAFIWGAVGRRYGGYGVGGAAVLGVLIGLVGQILIFAGTVASDLAGVETYFNDPVAVMGSPEPVTFGMAVLSRTVGLVGNSLFSGVLGAAGWTLGGMLPERKV